MIKSHKRYILLLYKKNDYLRNVVKWVQKDPVWVSYLTQNWVKDMNKKYTECNYSFLIDFNGVLLNRWKLGRGLVV